MANKSLTYKIGFSADTAQLQQAVNQAITSLQKIGSTGVLTGSLKEASNSAHELAGHLHSAFNQGTGQLDLITLNQSLKASGKTLGDYH